MKNRISLLMILIMTSFPFISIAQKLPKIQDRSIRAPESLKIDGKLLEWSNQLYAYNTSNRIYYTISNDDENLYLALRGSDNYASEKAIFGISFIVKPILEKGTKSKESMVVTFPPVIEVEIGDMLRDSIVKARRLQQDTSLTTRKKIELLRSFADAFVENNYKMISMVGIKQVQKTAIPLSNLEGIRVAAKFDDKMQYVYELAVPLKLLNFNINSLQKFNYTIKMDGVSKPVVGRFPAPVIMGDINENMGEDNAYVFYPTDLTGTYTLIKK